MLLSKHIESFLMIADCGSIQEASNRLYISNSALSQQMKLLEQELGVQLFHRSYKGVALTASGVIFREKMILVQQTLEEAKQLAIQAAHESLPALKIACAQNILIQELYVLFSALQQKYQQEVCLESLSFPAAVAETKKGNYDGCIVPFGKWLKESGMESIEFNVEHPDLAVPLGHPFLELESISISDLDGKELVLPAYGQFGNIDTIYDELKQKGIHPQITIINDPLQSDIYCSNHNAVRICRHQTFSPKMKVCPLDTSIHYSICLAYYPTPGIKAKIGPLISVIKNGQPPEAAPTSSLTGASWRQP